MSHQAISFDRDTVFDLKRNSRPVRTMKPRKEGTRVRPHDLIALLLLSARLTAAPSATQPLDLPTDPSFWQHLETLPPTPKGDGYLRDVKPGQFLQFRYEVPKQRPPAFLVNLDNIVAMDGKGSSYQVEIHADSPEGPLLYKGAKLTDGYAFNAEDLSRVNATELLTDKHLIQGYIDLYVTAQVEGDTWTTYRDDDKGRDLYALVPDPVGFVRWRRLQEERAALLDRGVLLLPQPQRVELRPNDFVLSKQVSVALLGSQAEEDRRTAEMLADDLSERTACKVPVVTAARSNQIRLLVAPEKAVLQRAVGFSVADDLGAQGYALDVRKDSVVVAAPTAIGLFYAARTLSQLLRVGQKQPVIGGVRIVDWPDLKHRMVQYDIARGNTVNVQYWKHWIRELSRLKINEIMLYMEDDYHFQKYPFLGRADTFTPEKAGELVAYAREHHIELVPQIESLGHADALLSHNELKDLRLAGGTWAICPCAERALPVLDDLFGELAEAFPQSPLFHVGGDEVWGFGADPRCAAMVKEVGEEGVYAFHLNNLQKLLSKRGRKMAFWGDEVLAFPKVCDSLTRDAVVFDWHYGDQKAYPSVQFFQERGFKEIYVCPAVHGYFDVYPQYRMAFGNISGFTRAGVEKGVEGVCCTTWGMNRGGNAENYLYGLSYAAQCAWSSKETERGFFDDRFAAVWLGIPKAKGARDDINRAFWFAWRGEEGSPFWQRLFEVSQFLFGGYDQIAGRRDEGELGRLAREADSLRKLCAEATDAIARLRAHATRNTITLDALQHAVNCHAHVANKITVMAELAKGYRAAFAEKPRRAEALVRALESAIAGLRAQRAEHAQLEEGFEQGIRDRCGDPEDLRMLLSARDKLDAHIARLMQARADLAAGKAPPDPASLGLGWRVQARVGQWRTQDVNPSDKEHPRRIVIEVTEHVKEPGSYEVEWDYTAGEDGLDILSTGLFWSTSKEKQPGDLQPVAVDEHHAFTGAAGRDNWYKLRVTDVQPTRRFFIVGVVYNQRTFNTFGEVWLRRGWEE